MQKNAFLLLLAIFSTSSCGGEAYQCIDEVLLWDSQGNTWLECASHPCVRLCQNVRNKLIDQIPGVSPEDVDCAAPLWRNVGSCEDCFAILSDNFDVSATDTSCVGWEQGMGR